MEVIITRTNDELCHHGIKGQKWGVRRYQNKDGSLTDAGRKRYTGDGADNTTKKERPDKPSKKEKKKLTNKQKVVIVGASIVAAYTTYKFVDSGEAARLARKGKALLGHSEYAFKRNMDLAKKDMSSDDILTNVVKRINPDHGKLGTSNNCRRCTFAYELSRRGYDVQATKTLGGSGQTSLGLISGLSGKKVGLGKYFKDALFDESSISSKVVNGKGYGYDLIPKFDGEKGYTKSVFDALSKYPDGARGELSVGWSIGGGHSVAWEIVKGRPVIFDCQDGTMFSTPEAFEKWGQHVSKAAITRLDNLDLNNDFLMRWVKNA